MGIKTCHGQGRGDGVSDLELDEKFINGCSMDFVWRRRFFWLLACWIFTLILSIGWTANLQRTPKLELKQKSGANGIPYSPANAHIVYENREIVSDADNSPFEGSPREELDEAWYDLLQGTLIRVSEEELKAANQTSVPLEGGGYGVGLGLSHSLHCLRRIYKYVHKSYYFPTDDNDWAELEYHVDHCIEALRQTVMCQVDTMMYPLVWEPEFKLQPAHQMPRTRTCVNFDVLHDWMLGRAASMENLIRPPDSFFDGP